jgi:hypothetical protein
MKMFIAWNKYLKIFFLPAILLFTISFTGCDKKYAYSDEYYDDGGYDDGGYGDGSSGDDGGYDDEPDYPDTPDGGDYNEPDDPAPTDDDGYDIIPIGYWKISLTHGNAAGINNSLSKTSTNVVKYYVVEESPNPDFSNSKKFYKLHKNYFKPYSTLKIKLYYKIKAVYTGSASGWSNIVVSK